MKLRTKVKKFLRLATRDKWVLKANCHKKIKWVGNDYGGFGVDTEKLPKAPRIYSFGVGEDVSFDMEMIKIYGGEVYAFDPTPKTIEWVKDNVNADKFHFYPYGISDKDEKEKFYLPENENYVSCSTIQHEGMQTAPIIVDMYRLSSIMQKMGHEHIDLLKLDIEGSEFKVIPEVIESLGTQIPQICVEIHGRFYGENGYKNNQELVELLEKAGYTLEYVSDSFDELTFIHD